MKNIVLVNLLFLASCIPAEPSKPISQAEHYGLEQPHVLPAAPTETSKNCIPQYTITVESRMHSFSLDPFKHMRNAMNANVYTIPVDEKTYNELEEGRVLDKQFDTMGLMVKGSWQSMKTTVLSKQKTCI